MRLNLIWETALLGTNVGAVGVEAYPGSSSRTLVHVKREIEPASVAQ